MLVLDDAGLARPVQVAQVRRRLATLLLRSGQALAKISLSRNESHQ